MQIDRNGDLRAKITTMKPTTGNIMPGCISNSDDDQDGPIGTGTYVTELGPADVLLGRGTGPSMNEGNVSFRQLVVDLKPDYVSTASRKAKKNIVRKAVNGIKAKKGRFLMKLQKAEVKLLGLKKKDVYEVVRDSVAIEKTKQAIRYVHYKKDSSQLRSSPSIGSRKHPEQKVLSSQVKAASPSSSAKKNKNSCRNDMKVSSTKEQPMTLPRHNAVLSGSTIDDGHTGSIHSLNTTTTRTKKQFQPNLMPAALPSTRIPPQASVLEGLYMNSPMSRVLPNGIPLSTMGISMLGRNPRHLPGVPQSTHSLQQGLSPSSFPINSPLNIENLLLSTSIQTGAPQASAAAQLSNLLHDQKKANQVETSILNAVSNSVASNERQGCLHQSSASSQNSSQLQALLLAEVEHRRRVLGTLFASLPP